jgi:hypothetical protein
MIEINNDDLENPGHLFIVVGLLSPVKDVERIAGAALQQRGSQARVQATM